MEAVDNTAAVEQLAHETPTGFIRKVTKFTVIATMIQWLVGRKTSADAHIQKAIQYLQLMKSGKVKPNEKDKFCIKQCERKFQIMQLVS